MRSPLFRTVAFLSCSVLILAAARTAKSEDKSEPQLVRVSYAQGEVKFSPGKNGKPDLGTDWFQVPPDLTLEQGYSLATENGRAVVEFENGSVAYLAEHSVLQFEKLQIKDGLTSTRLNLLTGTATIDHVSNGQDLLSIDTPAVKNVAYKQAIDVRFDSTLNGTIVRTLNPSTPAQPNPASAATPVSGETFAYISGSRFQLKPTAGLAQPDTWDQWVDAQRFDRAASLQKALQESGLTQPIPGLADLAQTGHFFDCPPYGKCWEPNPLAGSEQAAAQSSPAPNVPSAPVDPRRQYIINRTLLLRCPMAAWRYTILWPDPSVPFPANAQQAFDYPFPWSACFAGTWIHHRKFVYVVGHRHKKPPVRIVHTRQGVGFVPRHPLDQKGKPPLNAKNGIFTLALNKGELHAGIEPAPKTVQLESSLPRSFTQEHTLIASTLKATPPDIQGRMIHIVTSTAGAQREIQAAALPQNQIHYDYKTHNFVAPRTSSTGVASNNSPIVVAHVGSHGASGGVVGHAGNASGYSGTSGGHASGGSYNSGGGGHSGGSSSGGAGGGHSGGGYSGGSSGGAGSGASSSGGGAASGGHH
jgi:FecR protein